MLVVIFEFTDEARGFMIMSCAARGVKKVGQHWCKRWWVRASFRSDENFRPSNL